jgi:GAF domain-containing protein
MSNKAKNGEEDLFFTKGMQHVMDSSDVQRTVRDLVRVAAEAVGSEMGALYLLDKTGRVLKPAVVVNLPEEYVQGCGDVPVGQQCCGRAALHQSPWYVEDIWINPLFPPATRDAARRAGVRAGFSVPVMTEDGRCLGSLSAHFREAHLPGDFEIERHLLFARLIGFALSRSQAAATRPQGARSISDDRCDRAAASD